MLRNFFLPLSLIWYSPTFQISEPNANIHRSLSLACIVAFTIDVARLSSPTIGFILQPDRPPLMKARFNWASISCTILPITQVGVQRRILCDGSQEMTSVKFQDRVAFCENPNQITPPGWSGRIPCRVLYRPETWMSKLRRSNIIRHAPAGRAAFWVEPCPAYHTGGTENLAMPVYRSSTSDLRVRLSLSFLSKFESFTHHVALWSNLILLTGQVRVNSS